MKKNYAAILIAIAVLLSCNPGTSKKESIAPDVYANYLQKGNDISGLAQGVLLTNVGKAIQQGGPVHAVEFCNLKASSITDSLNQANNCVITRVSEKNRNPENFLQNETDKNLWEYYSGKAPGAGNDTLVQAGDELIFYKPIRIGMPACLNCHGTQGKEIDSATFEKLQTLYPADLATGYQLNELRGMWKIHFEAN
jgi:hypothetical protein